MQSVVNIESDPAICARTHVSQDASSTSCNTWLSSKYFLASGRKDK